jgi:hypothetical protein
VSHPDALQGVVDVLPPGWKPATKPVVDRLYSLVAGDAAPRGQTRRYTLLYEGAARLARTMDHDAVVEALERDLSLYVAEYARGLLFVHAGVVSWQGRAIVLPGPSYTGKSTLVAALLRAGATYYSDEFAVFDRRGRVHPFPRPLSLREQPGGRPKRYAIDALEGGAGTKPLPVGLVAMTRYRDGARFRPRPLSCGEAVLALLANTVSARRQPDVAFRTLRQVVSGAQAVKGSRGEADGTVDALLHMVCEAGRPAADARHGTLERAAAQS